MAGLSAALELPILMAKGASFDPEDRQAVKQAFKEKLRAKILLNGIKFFKLDICVEPV
jgi:hypothetical protein